MKNYSKTTVDNSPRTELHEILNLTGAEVTVNNMKAGGCVPFVHLHKENEEIYGILSGKGKVIIDGEAIELAAGDWIRISPEARRQFFAADDSDLSYICIQAKTNSLGTYTNDDAIIE